MPADTPPINQPKAAANKTASKASESTTDRIATAAHDAVDRFAVHANKRESQIREAAQTAGEQAEVKREQATEQFNDVITRVEAYVREKPLASAGIAFMAGIVANAILRRR